ncbi:hypothetical protein [Poseidonibacter lekithochrous]|uniref:hypothetical protein n=1 Tax=Poseidonibacter lekithochrous TaxID=1904463 RepID=UPI0008FC4945|nr:hypothetical protein [Poseidonibacter lekithochrous]QKJ22878.1 hypothetical protein ALEK_1608 [Poseidonibacter lekithochrous]
MNQIKTLEDLLRNDVLKEVNENIEELVKAGSSKKAKKDEIKYMEEVRNYFTEVLKDIENNSLSQEDAIDILEGLEDMRAENQEV